MQQMSGWVQDRSPRLHPAPAHCFPCRWLCSLSAEAVAQGIFVHKNIPPTLLICDLVTKGVCIFEHCEGMKNLCPQEEVEVKYPLSI